MLACSKILIWQKNAVVKEATIIETKVRALGDELAIVLPKEILAELKLEENHKVLLVPTEHGYTITVQDEAFAK
jgi:hypothetical protein